MIIHRRDFARTALAGLASVRLFAAKKIPIAVQVYSVRQIAAQDTAGVLAQIAKLGYQGVEFAGFYGHSAPDIKKMLDNTGLKAAGSHTGIELLMGDNFAKTVDFNRTIGNRNIVVPSLPAKYHNSIAGYQEAAKVFTDLAARLKPEGFTLGYHNHIAEFHPMDGQMPFDVFFGTASPDVKVQLDLGHAAGGGADPVALIRRYRGRILSVHVKDYSPAGEVTVGNGVIKWKQVFAGLESSPGMEWYIIEEEGKSCQGTDCIARSIARMHEMGK